MAKKTKAPEELAVVDFKLDKETKNTFRYKEVKEDEDSRASMGTIYLLKSLANGAKKVRVTVETR